MYLPRLVIMALTLAVAPLHAGFTPEQAIKTLPAADVEKMLPQEHPSSYYVYASRLFSEGKKDDAVFWFYVGQLRYRFHLKANPNLPPSGDPALFASLNATVGKKLNEYAGGNLKEWVKTMDRALKWDADTENGFTSKKKFTSSYEEIRAGLKKMRDQVKGQGDLLREQREKAGLENRS